MLITHQATLLSKKQLTGSIFFFQFSYPNDQSWTFRAGQYMIFHIPVAGSEHAARRLYSLASFPQNNKSLDFIIEIVPDGIASTHLSKMNIGETLTMQGPAGIFTYKNTDREAIFLATGTGIAPIYSMIHDLTTSQAEGNKRNLHLFWGLKYKKDIYFKEEIDQIAKNNPNFHYALCLSREEEVNDTNCLKGRVTQGLELLSTNYDFYLCGGPQVVESLRIYLAAKGVPKEQVSFEKFT